MSANQSSSRLLSLDAFRGFIMLLMASSGFGIVQMAEANPGSFWETIRPQFEHKAWQSCSLWDLIQPSFMFMVGIAVPLSCAKRREAGQSFLGMTWHAFTRAVLLILIAVVLSTRAADKQTTWIFTNVLAQIGLGYVFLFLIARLGWEYMTAAIIAILAGYTAFFAMHPLPTPEQFASIQGIKVPPEGILNGWFGHWSIHFNAAAHFDRWFLNQLPQAQPFVYNAGGYQTLNFIPALATMLGGALTGDFLMRSRLDAKSKAVRLFIAGVLLIFLGTVLDLVALPSVKRIWTPTWAIQSGGWVLILLTGFYSLVEIAGWRRLVFPLVVVGMNSITIYVLHSLCAGWINDNLHKHLPSTAFPAGWEPVIDRCGVLLVLWLICWWLHRQKAFLRL
ncbi:MAG: acyltransferase family protein [Prosthecobacter sp.]|jgi:heparan-alpha-glucosaminide N-acetyltransferase